MLLCHTTKTQDVFFTNDADRSQKIQEKNSENLCWEVMTGWHVFFCEQNLDVSNGLVWCVFFCRVLELFNCLSLSMHIHFLGICRIPHPFYDLEFSRWYLGVPLTVYPWYSFCSPGILEQYNPQIPTIYGLYRDFPYGAHVGIGVHPCLSPEKTGGFLRKLPVYQGNHFILLISLFGGVSVLGW